MALRITTEGFMRIYKAMIVYKGKLARCDFKGEGIACSGIKIELLTFGIVWLLVLQG